MVVIIMVTTDITAGQSSSVIRITMAITTTMTTDIRIAAGYIAVQCRPAAPIGGVAIAIAPTDTVEHLLKIEKVPSRHSEPSSYP
jgi:hypothetical protein